MWNIVHINLLFFGGVRMIHRIKDFLIVLLVVWGGMMIGLWFINYFIVPLDLSNNLFTGTLQVLISGFLTLTWLFIWKNIVKKMFWSVLEKREKQSS
jgi:hypothetical protein